MGRARLAAFYFLHFSGIGVTLPFLPVFLRDLGVAPSQVGVLLAVAPAFALLAPPLWGQLADRTGRPGLVLCVQGLGATLGLTLLGSARDFGTALVALALLASFSTGVTSVTDALALRAVAAEGGSYGRVRVYGSLGFVVAGLAFGAWVDVIDRRVVWVPLALQVATFLWAVVALRGARAPVAARSASDARAAARLLARPAVWGLLLGTSLHWVACAPFHGVFGVHVGAAGFAPWVVTLCTSVGVVSEMVVMATWPRWSRRLSPPLLLALSFAASGVRWVLLPEAGLWGLVALSLIHGLTFGAFYLASVSWMADQAPDALRATGQALFVAGTFGVGGVAGYLLTGQLWEALGTASLFRWAGAFEVVPALLALRLWRMNRAPARS